MRSVLRMLWEQLSGGKAPDFAWVVEHAPNDVAPAWTRETNPYLLMAIVAYAGRDAYAAALRACAAAVLELPDAAPLREVAREASAAPGEDAARAIDRSLRKLTGSPYENTRRVGRALQAITRGLARADGRGSGRPDFWAMEAATQASHALAGAPRRARASDRLLCDRIRAAVFPPSLGTLIETATRTRGTAL